MISLVILRCHGCFCHTVKCDVAPPYSLPCAFQSTAFGPCIHWPSRWYGWGGAILTCLHSVEDAAVQYRRSNKKNYDTLASCAHIVPVGYGSWLLTITYNILSSSALQIGRICGISFFKKVRKDNVFFINHYSDLIHVSSAYFWSFGFGPSVQCTSYGNASLLQGKNSLKRS